MKRKLFFTVFLFISFLSFGQLVQQGGDIDGEAAFDSSGWSASVSNDGTVVAVGAPFNNDNGIASGQVRVHGFDGASWMQLGGDLDGAFAGDRSGSAVSLSGDGSTVAIGAPLNDNSGGESGHVRIYSYDGANWIPQGADLNGEGPGDRSGTTVSLSDDGLRVAIGAPYNGGGGSNSGHVRIYEFQGGSWVQLGTDINGPAANDLYGNVMSISGDGNRLAVGVPAYNGAGTAWGYVRIYEYNGADWQQLGPDIEGTEDYDYLGRALSLNYDGSRIAVGGAPNTIGEGGSPADGYVRIYDYDGMTLSWVQAGSDIVGDVLGDRYGSSVSLSNDGNTLAVGAPYSDGGGGDSGGVRVHSFDGANWVQQGQADGESAGDQLGFVVGISGDGTTVVAGAPFNGATGAGYLRAYMTNVLSAPENGIVAGLQLYPNPAAGFATITLPHSSSAVVKINDVQGRLVYQNQYDSTTAIVLDTRSLARGLYFVSVAAEGERTTLKMIVN